MGESGPAHAKQNFQGGIMASGVIYFQCGQCGKKLKVQEELAGKKGKCPGCGKAAAIPNNTEAASNAKSDTGMPTPAPPEGEERTVPPNEPRLSDAAMDERTMAPANLPAQDAGDKTRIGAKAKAFEQ